jgi:cytochrome P450
MDIITYLCFGSSVDAINAPGFQAPIIEAMDASLPVFVRFKHSELYKNMIMNCPPKLSKLLSPATSGLVDMQQMIKSQIQDLAQHPEKLKHLPHNMTIYHQLMDREAYRTNTVPSEGSLYEETQALMFAGSDTTGNALMVGTFHLLKQPDRYAKFKKEIMSVWPKIDTGTPSLRELEILPYFNAVIKESLRLSVGVVSGLLRVVPKEGAKIGAVFVPGDVCILPLISLSASRSLANSNISYSRPSCLAAPPSSTSTQSSSLRLTNSVLSAG